MTRTAPGWYPQADGRQRYWDGQQWTEHFSPGSGPTAVPSAPAASEATSAYPAHPGHRGQPGAPAPQGRPWFRKKRFIVPAALVLLAILFNVVGGGSDSDTTAASTTRPAPTATPAASAKPAAAAKKATAPGMGSKVRDGDFEFVVTKVSCGISQVGSADFGQKAQGQFCRVDVTVSNIGNEPQTMFSDNQYAFDAKGHKFSASSEAAIWDDKAQLIFEEINPGNSLKGRIYFDVPKNAKPVELELHDSMFSDGVKVRL